MLNELSDKSEVGQYQPEALPILGRKASRSRTRRSSCLTELVAAGETLCEGTLSRRWLRQPDCSLARGSEVCLVTGLRLGFNTGPNTGTIRPKVTGDDGLL